MTNDEEIMRDITEMKRELSEMRGELTLLRRALIGSYDSPGGLAVAVAKNERDIAQLNARFAEYKAQREQLVKEYDTRVTTIEDWMKGIQNKAIGIGIGVTLGSAGIGAAVATAVTKLVGP